MGAESPAETAGLKTGDVILKLNDKPLATRDEMQAMLKEMATGDEIKLEIERAGKTETLTLNLGER